MALLVYMHPAKFKFCSMENMEKEILVVNSYFADICT